MGEALGTPCVTNVWIPDGSKDTPVDRKGPRERLKQSLDTLFAEPLNPAHNLDAVESKLFGLGSESYVVGSHEFYLGYAIANKTLLCLDSGHFHPTEIHLRQTLRRPLLGRRDPAPRQPRRPLGLRPRRHPQRRNPGHRPRTCPGNYLSRTHLGLDFFDASINRVAAWVIGTRAFLKALSYALLEPKELLRGAEAEGDYATRLAILEECKTLPHAVVWHEHCRRSNVPLGLSWFDEIKTYERDVLSRR